MCVPNGKTAFPTVSRKGNAVRFAAAAVSKEAPQLPRKVRREESLSILCYNLSGSLDELSIYR